MAEETVILHFEVDQSKAERQLEKIEGLLLDNKKAQQDLTKAYKDGNITQEEYVKENIRLQQNIKKEQDQKRALIRTLETESNSRNAIKQRVSQLTKEYDNLNLKTAQGAKRADELEKELAQLNAQLTKGDKAAGLFKNQIGNYPQQFGEAAKSINVAGVSVGDLTTRLASFANPATAAIGLVTALGTAYANSTRGAKDLEFAQNQLTFTLKQASNQFAELISGEEDGQGLASLFTTGLIQNIFGTAAAVDSVVEAIRLERLEDLARLETQIREENNQRIEENQDLLEQVSDEQKTIIDRLKTTELVESNLRKNKEEILKVLNDQLAVLNAQLKSDSENEALQDVVLDKRRQISKESANLEKQISRIDKLQDDLNKKLASEVELRRKAAQAELELFGMEIREANAPNISLTQETASGDALAQPVIEASKARQKQFIAELQTVDFTEEQKRENYLATAALQQELAEQQRLREQQIADGILAIGSSLANGLSKLAKEGSEEQKALALTGIAFDTASAIAGAVANAQVVGYPGNLAAMASSIAAVLAAIAEANAVISGYADGGWTGPGNKYDVAGVVHADEYVVPKHVNNSPAAQPHLAALERMRGGYADGGFVANQSTASAQQALIMANALNNLPVPELSVVEFRRVEKRVLVKEQISRMQP